MTSSSARWRRRSRSIRSSPTRHSYSGSPWRSPNSARGPRARRRTRWRRRAGRAGPCPGSARSYSPARPSACSVRVPGSPTPSALPSRRRCAPLPQRGTGQTDDTDDTAHGDVTVARRGGDRDPPGRVDPSSGPHPEQPAARRHLARQRGAGPSAGPGGRTSHRRRGRDHSGRAASVERGVPATRRVRRGHRGHYSTPQPQPAGPPSPAAGLSGSGTTRRGSRAPRPALPPPPPARRTCRRPRTPVGGQEAAETSRRRWGDHRGRGSLPAEPGPQSPRGPRRNSLRVAATRGDRQETVRGKRPRPARRPSPRTPVPRTLAPARRIPDPAPPPAD